MDRAVEVYRLRLETAAREANWLKILEWRKKQDE
jgi:hypothetical protein